MIYRLSAVLGFIVALLFASACKKDDKGTINPPKTETYVGISTDKAYYKPGESVTFTLADPTPAGARIRYKFLDAILQETAITQSSWQWNPPADDFKGYMAEIFREEDGKVKVYGCIGIDVSSTWTKFPRYGFLSEFPQMTDGQMETVVRNLNRHHLNGIQYYDWQYKHHLPLAGTPANPASQWKDLINRDVYSITIKNYIQKFRNRNIHSMFYNLCFGAWENASQDGVDEKWYLFTDNNHANKDKHELPKPPFLSDIYLLNPADPGWLDYITQKNNDVYAVYDFDGYHIDQLGNRGTRYLYDGSETDLTKGYATFIKSMKMARPEKSLIMNAVNQYGQYDHIATSPVDFLYTEVWSPNESFNDLSTIIKNNNTYSNNTKNTVLAAYMDYSLADNKGYFNTPGVLYANAVIFAFGGAHIELGEHMLGKEYFPNANLQMKPDLIQQLPYYYDFLVAYENLLRDGGDFNTVTIASADNQVKVNNWPPQAYQVSAIGKTTGDRQVIHLINFSTTNKLMWRDTDGSQIIPYGYENLRFNLTDSRKIKKIWMASPDYYYGSSTGIDFSQNGNEISFTLPYLKYWDMVVVEYQ